MSKDSNKAHWFVLKKEDHRKHIAHWYQSLHGLDSQYRRDDRLEPKRGMRADLRRSRGVEEAMMKRGFMTLSYGLIEIEKYHLESIAAVSVLLATADKHTETTLPTLLGRARKEAEVPTFSEMRFQRLMASNSIESLLKNMRRALTQADKQANALRLADSVLHWSAEQRNPDWFQGASRWQYSWAKQYYSEVFKYQKAA